MESCAGWSTGDCYGRCPPSLEGAWRRNQNEEMHGSSKHRPNSMGPWAAKHHSHVLRHAWGFCSWSSCARSEALRFVEPQQQRPRAASRPLNVTLGSLTQRNTKLTLVQLCIPHPPSYNGGPIVGHSHPARPNHPGPFARDLNRSPTDPSATSTTNKRVPATPKLDHDTPTLRPLDTHPRKPL